jgi:GntR family transcriptional regulator, trigonelline degradation regulator
MVATKTSTLRVAREQPTLRELTTQKLRDAILKMHFKPNERLVERDLCEQTGVSRTSVREALRHLEAEGLVERGAKGLFVASLSPEEAAQIYEVRAAIEAAMARRFAERATSPDLAALGEAMRALESAAEAKAVRPYVVAFDRFYDVLLRGSGNEVARRILGTLRARITYLRSVTSAKEVPGRRAETMAFMRTIVEAAERRDGDAMAQRCAAFVERSAEFALEVLRQDRAVDG